jgi:hypothetical protein
MAGLSLLGAGALAFGVMAPPERCPSVTAGDLRVAATEAVDWFVRNQEPDGTWLYLYDAESDRAADDYNVVRHAGGVMGLYQAAGTGIPGALDSADRGLGWAQDHLIERDDWAALSYGGRTATGATALLVAGLVERRDATGDDRHDDLLAKLGRFLAAQIEPSGAVLASYDVRSGAPEPGVYSAYFTGEAYWALARLHRLAPGDPWGDLADRIGAYLATRRDDAEDRWPPVPDHWAAYGLAETVAFDDRREDEPLTEDEVAYAREQAGYFGAQARWVSQRFGPWGALARHGPRSPRRGLRRRWRGTDRAVARRPGRAPAGRSPRAARRARDLHRRSGRAAADRPDRGGGVPASEPGPRRVVPRRRDPHGRPAARHLRAAAHDRHRRAHRRRRRP